MRARQENEVISVHAIAGTRVVLLGLDVKGDNHNSSVSGVESATVQFRPIDLGAYEGDAKKMQNKTIHRVFVGFAIDRLDVSSNVRSSLNNGGKPIQKFLWYDSTVLPGREYEYSVRRMSIIYPARMLTATTHQGKYEPFGSAITVRITTEDPSKGKHGVYFNRGLTGSSYQRQFEEHQRYHLVNKFGNKVWKQVINPRTIPDHQAATKARAWLSRGLEEAFVEFIAQADDETYSLRATAYELTHPETIRAFAAAVERGVDVKIVRHWRGTYRPKTRRDELVRDTSGNIEHEWIPDGTTDASKTAIDAVGFSSFNNAKTWQDGTFIDRKHGSGLQHNKICVILKDGKPFQVWTGSVNPTDGGMYGQLNVGHIVRDEKIARQYADYWENLSSDVPGRKKTRNVKPMDEINESEHPDLNGPLPSPSMTVLFSPRPTSKMLEWFADRIQTAKSVHFTAAFGVAQPIARALNRHEFEEGYRLRSTPKTAGPCLRYILLDAKPSENVSKKNHEQNPDTIDYFDFQSNANNRIAFGTTLLDDHHNDARKECLTGLNTYVEFVHTKILLLNPLTENPLVVTGSANFSEASLTKNDENMLFLQGDVSVADIYLTEYMRVFGHYHSRDRYKADRATNDNATRPWGQLVDDERWTEPYFDPASQLCKERRMFR